MDTIRGENGSMGKLATEFKETALILEQKLSLQEDRTKQYSERIFELENHIKDLSRQLEKWAVLAIGKKMFQFSPSKAAEERPAKVGKASADVFLLPLSKSPMWRLESCSNKSSSPAMNSFTGNP